MREDVAFEKAAAGEICIWDDAQIESMLWFVTQRRRQNDPVIQALNDLQRELWATSRDGARTLPTPANRELKPAFREIVPTESSRQEA
jgi:hypothetical protein